MIIITDTGSDILEQEAQEMDIRLVSITSRFPGRTFTHNTQAEFAAFYELLRSQPQPPISSQPSPEEFLNLFEEARQKDEEVLVLTISSGLSGTYNCAVLARNMCDYDKIYVLDTLQASLSLRLIVEYAVRLRDQGCQMAEIITRLEDVRQRTFLAGVPSTLLYLKKGGRLSPLVADIGELLNIKPILRLADGTIECKSKVRGMKAARAGLRSILEASTLEPDIPVYFAHSDNEKIGARFREEICSSMSIEASPLYNVGPAIGTHVGPDAMIMAFMTRSK